MGVFLGGMSVFHAFWGDDPGKDSYWCLSGRRLARLRYIRSGDFLPKARFSGRRGPSPMF